MSTLTRVWSWFVVFTGCHCTHTTDGDIDALPAACPGHGTHPIAKPERVPVLAEYAAVHLCGDAPDQQCPTTEVTQ